MLKSIIYITIILISSCTNTNNVSNSQDDMLDTTPKKLELNIIPFGGGDQGYTIRLEDFTLNSMIRDIMAEGDELVLGSVIKKDFKLLDMKLADRLYQSAKKVHDSKTPIRKIFGLDTWVYTLKWNDKEIHKFDSSQIVNQTEEVKSLIKILIKESPIKIDLPHFS